MENREKPAVFTKIIAGGIAGVSETQPSVPRRIRQNTQATPPILPRQHILSLNPQVDVQDIRSLRVLFRLRGTRHE